MRVLVLVKATKSSEAGEMPSAELLAAMGQYNAELAKAGILIAAEGLHPSSKAARVHFSGEKRIVTDGPFTETKELIAGFWLWRVDSLQQAVEWVKKCPNPMNEESDIDIRPVFDAADLGADFSADLREKEAALRAKGLGLNAPTFQDGRELVIVGVTRRYTSETRVAIPRQWEFFVGQASQIGGLTGATTYGVCWNAGADRGFDYLTGVEIGADQPVPKDFNTLRIEPRRYAVFAHTDHVSTLPKTIDTIWTKWVPDCGVKISRNAPCFERYTPEFNPQTGMGGMEVWLPLEA